MAAEFKFVFVEMGQGDCCMVRCPDGRVVVVDCGRMTNPLGDPQAFIRAQELLRTVEWAGGQGNKIAALILTHSDADHHNKVVELCNQITVLEDVVFADNGPNLAKDTVLAKIAIDKVYFSDALFSYGSTPLGNYSGGALGANICSGYFSTKELHEVSIGPKGNTGDTVKTVKTWSTPFVTANFAVSNLLIPRYQILSNTTEGTVWRVSIIAGNIERDKKSRNDTASEDNAKSLITLFEIGEKKALLTGDATYSTEAFLVKNHEDVLNAVTLVQVPHHGSKHGSNPKTVACFTSVDRAVVSVGFMEHSYRHPQYTALRKWLKRVAGVIDGEYRDIDYWTNDPGEGEPTDYNHYYNSWSSAKKDIASTESGSGSGGFWYLQQPDNGVFAYKVWGFGGNAEFLYREYVSDRLDMTSQGTQVYKLSSDGVTWAKFKPPEPADNPK